MVMIDDDGAVLNTKQGLKAEIAKKTDQLSRIQTSKIEELNNARNIVEQLRKELDTVRSSKVSYSSMSAAALMKQKNKNVTRLHSLIVNLSGASS